VINLCQAAGAPGKNSGGTSGAGENGVGAHQVQQFSMVCADGALIKNCVPPCTEALNGDELLLNIFGADPFLRFGPPKTVSGPQERLSIRICKLYNIFPEPWITFLGAPIASAGEDTRMTCELHRLLYSAPPNCRVTHFVRCP
jgi:hypothetical protein